MNAGPDRDWEPEELLAAGRPLPPWARLLCWALGSALVVALGAFLAIRALGGGTAHTTAALPNRTSSHSPQTAPPLFRQPGGGPRTLPPWPSARGACDDQPQLALVSGQRPAHGTGLTMLVGGSRVWLVDFDTGTRTQTRTAALGRDGYVEQLAASSAVVYNCRRSTTRTVSLGGQASAYPRGPVDVYQDGRRTYFVREATARHPYPLLVTSGQSSVRLPRHFAVVGVSAGLVVGTGPGRGGYAVLDARTGRTRAWLPRGSPLAVGGARVVSALGCNVARPVPCTVRSTSVSDGATRSYRIPRPPGAVPGVVSPDGREFAFALERSHPDRRYEMGYPLPPTDIAWLHLDTGRLDVVPGIELPGKVGLSLAFAPHSDWLVAALDAGRDTRLLAWRPGLAHPEGTAPITGPAPSRAGLEVTRG